MTLSLELNKSATITIFGLIDSALRTVTMKELQSQPHDYVIAANLMEVRRKLAKHVDDYHIFGGDREWKLKLTRAEALAFDVWFHPDDHTSISLDNKLIKPDTYEYGLILKICGMVNQQYYTS
ncbi:hypothetical protein [Runella sp. SP2]|uniref:hypothetical protein n=1 Tax=Runella sp. SP2 TaxID=2268026 RepID=UPI0013DE399C|nr:hypothetical protein [Runella sp. SP2]